MERTNDLWLTNARWVAVDGSLLPGPLRCADGRVHSVGAAEVPSEARVIDGRGGLIFPGLVDAHVHLREPGQAHKEGIVNGTRAALAGGVTTVLDMPNDRPPTTSPQRVAAKYRRFERKSLTSFGLFQQATMRGPIKVAPEIVGAKVYLARSSIATPVTTVARLSRILAAFPVVAVHAEHQSHLSSQTTGPHHLRRPVAAITAGLALVERALRQVPPEGRPRVVLCHVTGTAELEWLRRMKNEDFDIWGETCPHYLLLTQDDVARVGPRLEVNPPLRTAADQAALWDGLQDGTIDFLATDHAPHTAAEKAAPDPPSGVPGLEWLGPFVVSLAQSGRITWRRAVELGCANAARCYRLPGQDGLRSGGVANLALYQAGTSARRVVSRAGYCPYPGFAFNTRVAATVVNGELRYQDYLMNGEPR